MHCRWTSSTFAPTPDVQALIEQAWSEASRRPGVHLFDGPMCRLESFTAGEDRLELGFSRTSYKAFMGTNLRHAELADQYGWGILANPVGVSCALLSADNQLVMGQRNQRVAYYPGRIHPFAGALEPQEPLDVFAEVRRELAEELGLAGADLLELRCLGLVEDLALRQPELICLVRSGQSVDQIARQVDRGEHRSSWSVAAEEAALEAGLGEAKLLTPVGVGALLLAGRALLSVASFRRLAESVSLNVP